MFQPKESITRQGDEQANDEPEKRAFCPPVRFGHCATNPPPPLDFVLPGFLAGTVGGLVSQGGVGKSIFALEAAVAIAAGVAAGTEVDLMGLGISSHGRVVMLAGEDPDDAIWHRIHAMGKHFTSEQIQAIDGNLFIYPCLGEGVDIHDSDWLDAITGLADGARLMVIDTLTRFHSLDENSAADAKQVMSTLEGIAHKSGCSILFLHHINKSAAMNGKSDLQQSARGSSVFVDNARWLAFVAGMSAEEAEAREVDPETRHQYVRWNVMKQNYGAPQEDKWLKRNPGGVLKLVKLEKKTGSLESRKNRSRNEL